VRVPRWACDGALLVGDAAHAIPPHIGLGGSVTLEDIPILHEVVTQALARNDVSAETLEAFRRQRATRVAYARRVSEVWALITTAAFPGLERLRDVKLRSIARHPSLFRSFVETLALGRTPDLLTRLRLGLP
jgi:2-polyprenyl-6-methoxyphenol hydroxylase-like FAD-dependent oxidoreductase